MRTDPPLFRALAEARAKEPRFVVNIEFPSGSLYVTSHTGISGVPGVVLAGCLAEPNVVSQRLNPDEGRAEIGSASFRLVDLGSQFTTEIRTQLINMGRGLRNRRCRFYMGFAGQAWDDFQLIATQDVSGATFDRGAYSVECRDVQRSARKDVFTLAQTTLGQTVSATDTTIVVGSTTGFSTVYHGTSYSDAPSQTVGYIKIKDEVIRYTGKTPTSFTGCTRGVLGTTAAAYTVDAETPASRREKVTEHVYLELPGPKLLYALLTGVLHGDAATLPSTWHLGIPTDLIRLADFTGIGPDLWDLTNDANGVVLRFLGIGKTDGKKFFEEEVLRLLGLFSPVYADGTLGLRRMTRVLADSAAVATLDESNCTQVGALEHDMQSLRNVFTVEWNPASDGRSFTRRLQLLDAFSVTTHGRGEELSLGFRGLWGGRHTDSTVFRLIDGLRDRYAAPPERITVDVLHGLNRLEVGDVVRLKLAHVRDYAGTVAGIDRAFEIQSISVNHRTGKVTLDLFGSTAPASALSPTVSVTALPDAYYSAAGQPLTNVVPVTSGVAATGTYGLTGNADLTAGAAIYYHLGDLTIPQGTTLNISGNVQLRVRGSLTLNGTISGVGTGRTGVADTNTAAQPAGSPGFVGHSRGWDGINVSRDYQNGPPDMETVPAQLTRAAHNAFPVLTLEVSGNTLRGLPTDLRGTGGAPGGRILTSGVNIQSLGGSGANGGAGLAIIARGMGLGASSSVNLSGNSSAATSVLTPDRNTYAAGPGGAGGPGALLVLLDGSLLSAPDFAGRFVANTGTVTLPSGALPPTGQLQFLDNGGRRRYPSNTGVWMGYPNPDVITGRSLSVSALRIQYVPAPETPSQDVDSKPPPPTGLVAERQRGAIGLRATVPDVSQFDLVEFWASIDDNRANAVRVGEVRGDTVSFAVPSGGVRWCWARTRAGLTAAGADNVSEWFPTGSGVLAVALPRELNGASLNPDPAFADPTAWVDFGAGNAAIAAARFVTITDGAAGTTALRSPTGSQLWANGSDRLPIDPTKTYRVRARARRDATANGSLYVGVAAFDSAGATIAGDGTQWSYDAAAGAAASTSWQTYEAIIGAGTANPFPSTARTMAPLVILNYSGSAGYMEVQDLRIEEALPTNLIAPNAATNAVQLYAAGPLSGGNLAGPNYRGRPFTLNPIAVPHDALLIVTLVYTVDQTLGAANVGFTEIGVESPAGSGTWTYSTSRNPMSTAREAQALQWQFDYVANSLISIALVWLNTDSAGASANYRNIVMQAEWIKR